MHFSEERARELLFLNPPQPGWFHEQIESSWFVSRPYANILAKDDFHERRFRLHPLYEGYVVEKMRESEATYLRQRVRRNFTAIVTLKRFLHAWRADFKERYYAPGGGGFHTAMARWEKQMRE